MHLYQSTIQEPVSCTGIGLHSGRKVNMRLRPADPDTGVMFMRTDLPGARLIPADVHHVVDTSLCTTVGLDGVCVSTVEHLMSAVAGVGVDNLLVEIDSAELPVLDGSSAPFVFLLKNAGIKTQDKLRQYYRVIREVKVSDGDKYAKVAPGDELDVNFTIEFPHPLIKRQGMSFTLSERNYEREISRARTFGFLADMRKLQELKLGLGGSLDNTVVLDDYRVLNDDGLRFTDEFVRHKVLDFMGDLTLVGRPVLGEFSAHKSGHKLNHQLFTTFLADPQAWQLVTPSPEEAAKLMAAQAQPEPILAPVAASAVG